MAGTPVQRYDVVRLDSSEPKVRLDGRGFASVPGRLARTGVLKYTRADGSIVRELRLPEEVFKADSLDTLKGAPVVLHGDHQSLVTSENVGQVSVGHVGHDVRRDGDFIAATITVERKDAVDAVLGKELVELSQGYLARIEHTSGIWNGEAYDVIQRDIKHNHTALGPSGWGRSGSEVSLRLDSADSAFSYETAPALSTQMESKTLMKHLIELKGTKFSVEIAEELAPTFVAEVQRMDGERVAASDRAEKLAGENEELRKQLADLQTRYDAASAPEALDKAVASRLALVEQARILQPDLKPAGLTEDQIKISALVAAGHSKERFDSANSAFIDGAFQVAVSLQDVQNKGNRSVAPEAPELPEKRTDSQDTSVAAARQRMIEASLNAWKEN